MSTLKNKLNFLTEIALDCPAYLFLPYLALYLCGWFLKIPIPYIEKAFWVVHFANFLLLLHLFKVSFAQISKLEWFFWTVLFAVLWNRGAYLEYPSDPWDHFRRLTLWNDYTYISQNPYKNRIPYFFGWTFLKYFEPISQRTFLHFYSAFWQWLLSYQFARVLLKLGIKRERLMPYVFGTLVLFGTGILSFRYYMLSGVPLGYIAYLGALGLLLSENIKLGLSLVLKILLLCGLMVFSHPETFIFFAVSASAVGLGSLFLQSPHRRQIRIACLLFYALSLMGGYALYHFNRFPFDQKQVIWTAQLSKFTTFRMWGLESKFLETIAFSGVVSILACPFLYKKNPKVVFLTLFPSFVLLFPPFVLLIIKTFNTDTAYRILYSFPISILTVLLLETLLTKLRVHSKYLPALVCVLVLLIAVPYKYPWRGRLFFQIHRPKPARNLVQLDETAEWFFKNRAGLPKYCHFISDDLSNFSLYTHLGKKRFDFDRPNPLNFLKREDLSSEFIKDKIIETLISGRTICGALIARKADIPPPAYSIISIEGKLWPPQRGDHREYISDAAGDLFKTLLKRGWTRVSVPPYYDYYEPPYVEDLPPPVAFPEE